MKQIICAFLCCVGVIFFSCNSTQKSSENEVHNADSLELTTIEFQKENFDFGTIIEGEVLEHVYVFTNTGKAPLKIYDVQAACGCTASDYTTELVKPGDQGKVVVKFNSSGRLGNNTKTVSVYTNTDPNKTTLRFTAKVKSME